MVRFRIDIMSRLGWTTWQGGFRTRMDALACITDPTICPTGHIYRVERI